MSDSVLTVLFWVGVVMLSAFIVAGLASPRVRAVLQRPADDMVRRDRERWGGRRAEDEGDQE
ncbi:hypothetical protein I601_2840 [Nocardioides dokdonensis FR1436]|uniref:Uncharacterized protein n=1 Tax=Nocardioides dokdonensis FR1436 TaxID=1300347 RepID=A0A1A9GMG4_9ACTN|nr:hypothetical protein I601_2840 [Nocardioides dokdonensis FR1436]